MPKVNLNKSSKRKEGDFKRRKSTLGRGKHQHLSHTKIDFRTAKIKLLRDARFENTEVVSEGPTIEQLNNLLNMANHDTEKKIIQGFSGIQNIITKSPGLFVQNSGTIISAIMRKFNSSSEEVRKSTQNLLQTIFNRFNDIMLPSVPIICRYIAVFSVANSEISKNLSALLLEKVSTLHNLQPIYPLFQIFPQLIKSSPNPKVFIQMIKPMTKIIHIFGSKKKYLPSDYPQPLNFPMLFTRDNATFSKRFSSSCILTQDILATIEDLITELINILPKIQYDEGHGALIEICRFLTELNLLNHIDQIKPFVDFVIACGWPFEKVSAQRNTIVAEFLAIDPEQIDNVRSFLKDYPGSGTLLAIVGGEPTSNCLDDVDPLSLCNIKISREMQPIAFTQLINYYINEEHPSKKVLSKLIEIENKPENYQTDLFNLIEKKLVRKVPIQVEQKEEEQPPKEEKQQEETKNVEENKENKIKFTVETAQEETVEEEEEEMNEEQIRQLVVSEKEKERQNYIVMLIASCNNFEKDFFMKLVDLLTKKESDDTYFVPLNVAESIAQAIGTGRRSKLNFIISFLYSLGTKRPELRKVITRAMEFMIGYARDADEKKLLTKLDLATWQLK
ncbi:hypothetical protein TVAG_499370 [Trichomonas vaginalis G3]|uniref:Pre-rRNA-processing protein Ipi1 N-terminal domain-containing protein n=1 Tax=Trichomonas vaginalis (strain ATCC PRA-98 / G3) TaxID=412133 RepID=A2EIM4_TRIV3|nr:testis-expressed protein 10 family [Trichomonas vaginalis G3]EAY07451.1 hypothetical protein TVAG_499370 [Trichomonas vaginalis G3]KAI5487853.1 testis-expressed protein 10 family [Trichomonas vaginalis G3]|eukprot:XP_001319674.1 hypothetical protein [Trichomonas vaginalis G3]